MITLAQEVLQRCKEGKFLLSSDFQDKTRNMDAQDEGHDTSHPCGLEAAQWIQGYRE